MLDILASGLQDHFKKARWDHILGRTGRLNLGDNLVKGKKRHRFKLVQNRSASVSNRKVTLLGGYVGSNVINLFSKTSDEFFTDLWRGLETGGLGHI